MFEVLQYNLNYIKHETNGSNEHLEDKVVYFLLVSVYDHVVTELLPNLRGKSYFHLW